MPPAPPPLLLTEVPPPVPVVEPEVEAALEELAELELAEVLALEELAELELAELLEAEVEAATLMVAVVGPPVVDVTVEVTVPVVVGVPEAPLLSVSDPPHCESRNGRLATPTGMRSAFEFM